MLEYYQKLALDEAAISRMVDKLKTTGMVSMEDADAINNMLPGEIREVDPDVEFDFEESTEGHGVALEAAMNGLDRVKIAFIVAAIAFILKYITSLGKTTGNYSFSGGGSSGWGGSAPPAFKPTAVPGSTKGNQEEAEYNEILIEDLGVNITNFKEALAKVEGSLTPVTLEGAKNSRAYKSLIKVLSRIYISNSDKENFNIFGVSSPFGSFSDANKATEEKATFALVPKLIKHIESQYTTGVVLGGYKGDKLKLLPYVTNKDLAEGLKKLMTIANGYLQNPQGISNKLDEVIQLNSEIARKNDPVENAKLFINWTGKTFMIAPSNADAKNPLTLFIKETLEVPIAGIESIEMTTNIVGNTNFLNVTQGKTYLRELFTSLSGVETGPNGVSDDNKNDQLTDKYLISLSKDGLENADRQFKLSEMAEVVESFRENLTDVGGVEDLLEKSKKYVAEYAEIAQSAAEERNNVNADDEIDVGFTKNLIHHQAYVQNAVTCLVTIIAGYTNVSNQMTNFAVKRIEVYTQKLQAMNKDYYDLTQILNALASEIKP